MPDDSKDVKVGSLIALMVGEGEDWKSVDMPSGSGAPAAPSPVQPAASAAPSTLPTGGSGTVSYRYRTNLYPHLISSRCNLILAHVQFQEQ